MSNQPTTPTTDDTFAALATPMPSTAAIDTIKELPRERLRDLICEATDMLRGAQARLGQQAITYDEAQAAAYRLIHLRREAERRYRGRYQTPVSAVSAARLLRG